MQRVPCCRFGNDFSKDEQQKGGYSHSKSRRWQLYALRPEKDSINRSVMLAESTEARMLTSYFQPEWLPVAVWVMEPPFQFLICSIPFTVQTFDPQLGHGGQSGFEPEKTQKPPDRSGRILLESTQMLKGHFHPKSIKTRYCYYCLRLPSYLTAQLTCLLILPFELKLFFILSISLAEHKECSGI